MLLSLLLSTASASEAPLGPEAATPQAPSTVTSVWDGPPQLTSRQQLRLTHVQQSAAIGSVLALGAATLSTWAFIAWSHNGSKRTLAGTNVVLFAVPGALLGAATLAPAVSLASQGVHWGPTLGVASVAAGVASVFVAAHSRSGTLPEQSVFLAAGLAWASPLLALSEVLLASRAGWRQHDSGVVVQFMPTPQGSQASMTWSF